MSDECERHFREDCELCRIVKELTGNVIAVEAGVVRLALQMVREGDAMTVAKLITRVKEELAS